MELIKTYRYKEHHDVYCAISFKDMMDSIMRDFKEYECDKTYVKYIKNFLEKEYKFYFSLQYPVQKHMKIEVIKYHHRNIEVKIVRPTKHKTFSDVERQPSAVSNNKLQSYRITNEKELNKLCAAFEANKTLKSWEKTFSQRPTFSQRVINKVVDHYRDCFKDQRMVEDLICYFEFNEHTSTWVDLVSVSKEVKKTNKDKPTSKSTATQFTPTSPTHLSLIHI